MLYNDNAVLLAADREGQLFVVSEYKDDIDSIIESFKGNIDDFSEVASDFGIEITLQTGPDFAASMSEDLNAEVVNRGDFDNTAEESVYSEITERLTRSIDSNVTLRFGEEDPEVFEYDLILYTDQANRIIIEVKDASREEADLGKSKLIDTPRDKSNIIKSDDDQRRYWGNRNTNEVAVIVKHMDDDDFEEQKQMAERRDIKLLRYEDGIYLEELEDQFRKMTYMALY